MKVEETFEGTLAEKGETKGEVGIIFPAY